MARTIRRKKNRKGNRNAVYTNPSWWYEKEDYSPYSHAAHMRNEKELSDRYWCYHSDKMKHMSYRWFWRNTEERRLRMQHRQEIIKHMKNPGYEIQLDNPYCLSWYW